MIAAHHGNARTSADTDWAAIVTLYAQLSAMTGSPVVEVNRAVAVAMAEGPGAGLDVLNAARGLDDYYLWHATRGELLLQSFDVGGALESFRHARRLAVNPAEQRHLDRRVADVAHAENHSSQESR